MTGPLWVSIIVALIAGVCAAIVAPLVTAALTRRHWKAQTAFQLSQKSFELKYEVFQGAVDTLASWAADALDPNLQAAKPEFRGLSQKVAMRPETSRAMERYRGLVSAFFSASVSLRFEEALRAPISIDNVPNMEFETKRVEFVVSAAKELGLATKPDG